MCSGHGPPFVRDIDGADDMQLLKTFEFCKTCLHVKVAVIIPVENLCVSTDIPVNKRHLDMLLAHMHFQINPLWAQLQSPPGLRIASKV